MGRVDGKVAIVTGGASGLGRATVRRLVAEGARVVVADLDADAGQKVAADAGEAARFERHDVRDEESWRGLVGRIRGAWGGLHVLVNGAGIVNVACVEEETLEGWRAVQAVNSDGVFLGCKHGVPAIAASGGGSIVNLSSVAGLVGTPTFAAYSASKGAVRLLTKTVAAHCAELGNGVRCNSVHPGGIATPMTLTLGQKVGAAGPLTRELLGAMKPQPLGEPDDVAHLIVYLASDEAKHVNGAEIAVDGGETAV